MLCPDCGKALFREVSIDEFKLMQLASTCPFFPKNPVWVCGCGFCMAEHDERLPVHTMTDFERMTYDCRMLGLNYYRN